MNIRNCRKCGKVFNYITGLPICPSCKEAAEKRFQDVKKYIRENPNSDIRQVSEACEVEQNQIQQWIREERLQFSEDSPIKLPCESCGTMIRSGKYCERCKTNLSRGLSNAIERPKVQEPVQEHTESRNKMRFLDKH